MLDEYVASNTKFSASVCAVKLVVPSSIFEPEDKSGPAEDTDPAKILMLIDERSASTTPSSFIEPEAPLASGAKDINV